MAALHVAALLAGGQPLVAAVRLRAFVVEAVEECHARSIAATNG